MDTEMGTVTKNSDVVTSADQIEGSTAEAKPGYEFVRWMDVSNPADTILINETLKPTEAKNTSYIAIFKATEPEQTNDFTIWYVPSDATMGQVSRDKETVANTGEIQGSTASAKDGYQFVKWINEKGELVSKDAKLTSNVTESTVYVAMFEEIPVTPDPTYKLITATKTWEGLPAGTTAPSIKFELYRKAGTADEEKVTEQIVSGAKVNFGNYEIKNDVGVEYTYYVKEVFTNPAEAENWTVSENGLAVTNTLKKGTDVNGSLTITKKVIGNDATGELFSFTVTGPYGYRETVQVPVNGAYKLSGLRAGACTVVEKAKDNYNVDYGTAGNTVQVSSKNPGAITVTNTYKDTTPTPTEKDIIKHKSVSSTSKTLPTAVLNLLPNDKSVAVGSNVTASPQFTNVQIKDGDGYWTFIAWEPTEFKDVQKGKDYTFVGTWKWIAGEKPEKPGKPGGGFIPGWTDEGKPNNKETGRHYLYIKGYPDHTVRPDRQITRAETATMIARLEGLNMSNSNRPNFKDIESSWYNGAINAVTAKGLMQGYPDGTFRANAPMTRAEFAQLIKNINHKAYINKGLPFEDVRGHWGYPAIDKAYGTALITGYPDGTFRPDRQITRAEVARIVNKLYDRAVDETGLLRVVTRVERFEDLTRSHWAYYDLVEASNTHDYERRDAGKVMESWLRIIK